MKSNNSENISRNFQNSEEFQDVEINISDLKKYCNELQNEFQNYDFSNKKLTEGQKAVLANFPGDLDKLAKEIEQIQKEGSEFDIDETDPRKRIVQEQKKQKNQERLKQITAEVFIASCASPKPIEESLEFHKKNNLGVEALNNFNKNDVNPLTAILASGKNTQDLEKFLKVEGVDVNHKSQQTGSTALHKSAEMGVENESIQTLISNGGDINLKNNLGFTALDISIAKGDEKMSKFLIEKGGKSNKFFNAKTEQNEGRTRKIGDKKDNSLEDDSRNTENQQKEQALREEVQARQTLALIEAQLALALHRESMLNLANSAKEKLSLEASEVEKKAELEEIQKKESEEWQNLKDNLQESAEHKFSDDEVKKAKSELEILGINVDKPEDINKLLHDSARQGREFLSNLLIKMGGDVNYVKDGISVLGASALSGNNSLTASLSTHSNPQTIKNVVASFSEGDVRTSFLKEERQDDKISKQENQFSKNTKAENYKDNKREVYQDSTPSSSPKPSEAIGLASSKSMSL